MCCGQVSVNELVWKNLKGEHQTRAGFGEERPRPTGNAERGEAQWGKANIIRSIVIVLSPFNKGTEATHLSLRETLTDR